MCLSPLKLDISKRKKYFNLGDVLRKDVIVPCGRCAQCQMTSRNDLLLRTRSEYERCVSKGGKVAFLTFTYSDDNVPCYTYYLEPDLSVDDPKASQLVFCRIPHSDIPKYHGKWVFGFDKVQFRNSVKVMRETLARAGYKGSLRYICVSEYGTKDEYTQRPHYHALFFMDKELLSLIESLGYIDFTAFCNRYWKYGNVSASTKGLYLNDIKGCEYVAKYVTKANQLLELRNFKRLMDYIKSCLDLRSRDYCRFYTKTGTNIVKPYTYFSKVVRSFGLSYFVLKSLKFGRKILDDLKSSPDVVSQLSHGIDVEKYGVSRQYPYPSYILRNLLYSTRKDGSYFLNEFGRSIFMEKSFKNYMSLVKSTVDFLKIHMSYFQGLNVSSDVFDKKLLQDFSADVPRLIYYNSFVRGRIFPAGVSDNVNDFLESFYYYYKGYFSGDKLDVELFEVRFNEFCRYLLDSEIVDEIVDLDDDPDSNPFDCLRDSFASDDFGLMYPDGCNSCQFPVFDVLIDNYSAARAYLGNLKCEEYKRKNDSVKLIKDRLDFDTYKLN